jgi:hypothetical protein
LIISSSLLQFSDADSVVLSTLNDNNFFIPLDHPPAQPVTLNVFNSGVPIEGATIVEPVFVSVDPVFVLPVHVSVEPVFVEPVFVVIPV